MTIIYTGKRSEHMTDVFDRLLRELSGMYAFGSPRIIARTETTVTLAVDGVKL